MSSLPEGSGIEDGTIYFVAKEDTFTEGSAGFGKGQGIFIGWSGQLVEMTPQSTPEPTKLPEGLMIFRGISSTDPTEGTVTIGGNEVTDIKINDVVAYGIKEYICESLDESGNPQWREFGDENGSINWEEES